MGGFEKTTAQKKSNYSAANSSSSSAIQKKAVSVIQKAAPEEEVQQHKSDRTVQKAAAPDLEEKPLGVTQHKISKENPVNEIPAQRKENKTGMPDNLKSGIENLSGMNMDHVRVHYNSSQPAQLNALAYAQGSDIHVAPGQEKHLPHEAWHVVQQAQGRVQPTTQMKTGVAVNDDPGLEHEADVMGEKALQRYATKNNTNTSLSGYSSIQFYANKLILPAARRHYNDGWGARYGITNDPALRAAVPDSVRGSGNIGLGWFDAPEAEQDPRDRRFQKYCSIGYRDDIYVQNKTVIYHCGPSGARHYYGPPPRV
jgi:hypothetical protein